MPNMMEEFNRHYSETYLPLKDKSGVFYTMQVACKRDATKEEAKFVGIFVPRGDHRSRREITISGENLDFVFPTLGMINFPQEKKSSSYGQSMFITRTPTRQWKRAYHRNMINSMLPIRLSEGFLRHYFAGMDVLRWNRIEHHFFPVYYPYGDAIELVNNGTYLNCAFSRNYWVGVSPYFEGMVVGRKGAIIGRVLDSESVSLFSSNSPFVEELSRHVVIRELED